MKKEDQHIIGDFTDLLVDRIAERVVERLKEEGLVMAAPSTEAPSAANVVYDRGSVQLAQDKRRDSAPPQAPGLA